MSNAKDRRGTARKDRRVASAQRDIITRQADEIVRLQRRLAELEQHAALRARADAWLRAGPRIEQHSAQEYSPGQVEHTVRLIEVRESGARVVIGQGHAPHHPHALEEAIEGAEERRPAEPDPLDEDRDLVGLADLAERFVLGGSR